MAVFILCIVLFIGLISVAVMAGREQGNLLEKMGVYLYKFCCVHKLPLVETRQVVTDLERLYPNASKRELQMDYYVEKIKLFLVVLTVGLLLTFMLCLKTGMSSFTGTKTLERGSVGEGEQEIILMAEVGGEKEELHIQVAERQLVREKLEVLFQECVEELKQLILGKNESLECITADLNLPEMVEGYPFEILWKSSDFTLIDTDGELESVQGRSGETVRLTATLYYGEQEYVQEFLVKIASIDDAQTLAERLKEAVWEEDVSSRYEESIPLPEELDGEKIKWNIVPQDNSYVFLGLTLLAAVGVFFLRDKDLHEQTLQRKRSMKMAYPGILNKFVLYMGAGMTVRGSFLKVAMDYQKVGIHGTENPAYEEMLYSCNELSAGVSEGLVYERFGKRSGLQEYARFATMLGQNLKKGNSTLLIRLREEADKAMQEDLQFRKKIGEEAETKLLVPMIMMMGIVMLLVMLPAFGSF